ncbi:MAG TPA: hypothetical protein VGU44_01020 [Gammaproteobacteria bacterium]|nr:hypothetical protein [Gammaproteobacteria bacterium]
MKKYIGFIFSAMVAVLLSGCASTIHLSPAARARIHTVSIQPTIPVTSPPVYNGGTVVGNSVAASTGMLGVLIKYGVEAPDRDAIAKAFSDGDIQLNQIFDQKFTQKLSSETHFKLAHSGAGDAQFILSIDAYGFSNPPVQNKGAIPYVSVSGKLVDLQGNTVWKSSKDEYLAPSSTVHYRFTDYTHNPVLMKKAFNELMGQAADDLVLTLND